MKTETPRTDKAAQKSWYDSVEESTQLERELNELTKHVKLSLDNEKYGPCEWEAWNEKAKRLINQ